MGLCGGGWRRMGIVYILLNINIVSSMANSVRVIIEVKNFLFFSFFFFFFFFGVGGAVVNPLDLLFPSVILR